ncbi:hypothetical protein IBE33_09420 [Francisella philomiragia]|uniref:type IV secretion system protein n=1 Tax=Francisella philomiragia TaxID=28110 RepID=UPI00190455B9|nr:type IV secretion system protein [Francisella philomiragia]MBK2341729.1 hypothetical protein [Francisella philomiragia]
MSKLENIKNSIKNWFNPPKTKKEEELENAQTELVKKQLKNPENPYIATNAILATMAKDSERQLKFYLRMSRLWIVLAIVFAFLFFLSATSVRVKPYVVGMNQNGQIFDMSQSMKNVKDSEIKNKLALSQLDDFVVRAISVSPDGDVNNDNKEYAYAHVRGPAESYLQTYFKENDKREIAHSYSISVQIKYTMRLSPNTIKVSWIQTKKNPKTNATISKQAYVAEFMYEWDTRAEDDLLSRLNPIGFYINHISIEKDKSVKF